MIKKYDKYTQEKGKEEVKKPKEEFKNPKEIVKPKQEKKIVYKLADSSSSSSPDDEDEKKIYVEKIEDRSKKQIYHKQENNDSLDSISYKSLQEILLKRVIKERVKANLIRSNNAMIHKNIK